MIWPFFLSSFLLVVFEFFFFEIRTANVLSILSCVYVRVESFIFIVLCNVRIVISSQKPYCCNLALFVGRVRLKKKEAKLFSNDENCILEILQRLSD